MTQPKPDWRTQLRAKFAAEYGAQMKFAREIQCSEPHLSLVLRGKKGLSYQLAQRIHAKTGIAVDELMSPPLAPDQEPAQ